jgi:transposase InsO family protein
VHPNQLLPVETKTMDRLLKNESFTYWPLVSVYYYALHNKLVSMSLSTWYKYAALLNITRMKPKSIKHYGVSVRALAPNQCWHADVTQFKTQDGVLHYIYLVVDNFSKMVLSWAVDTRLSGQIRATTFRDALKTALLHHPVIEEGINLVVDGGSENNNTTVDEFIASISGIDIRKIRALKDVCFSNSQAEAVNRILKTAYLNHKHIPNTTGLYSTLKEVIHDYCHLRPHGSINGLTPFDCYTGKTVSAAIIKQQLTEARADRINQNSSLACPKCLF